MIWYCLEITILFLYVLMKCTPELSAVFVHTSPLPSPLPAVHPSRNGVTHFFWGLLDSWFENNNPIPLEMHELVSELTVATDLLTFSVPWFPLPKKKKVYHSIVNGTWKAGVTLCKPAAKCEEHSQRVGSKYIFFR